MSSSTMKSKIHQMNTILSSINSSLNSVKNLVRELEEEVKASSKDVPGIFGKFVGDAMLGEDGQKYPIPQNYASKSLLVYGDKMKMYEEEGAKRFKQIEKVKRLKVEGVLAKKEGKWHAVTSEGSYRVLDNSVEHFNGVEGSKVVILIPEGEKFAPFAALESLEGGFNIGKEKIEATVQTAAPVVAPISTITLAEAVKEPKLEAPKPAVVVKSLPVKNTATAKAPSAPAKPAQAAQAPKKRLFSKPSFSAASKPVASPAPVMQSVPNAQAVPVQPLTEEDLR